ncbi:TonB-dependent receptor plug domain-containing protein [Gracilimonas mengyeensis]|nr:TonB-dependent receptor [Gracilimonas mengyeensis]
MKYLLPLFIIFSTLSWNHAQAQLKAELDSIAVTASRITTAISESGKNVSVITVDDIREMPVQSVDDLLRSLPGININARQGFGMQADVGVRGSTFSQVLFLLDNVPLNDPLTAHFNTNIPVALSEIAQIELIRGPASTSFGADAVGGVVHIKTKSYMRREIEGPEKLQARTEVDASVGQHSLQIFDATAGVSKKNWRFSTSVRTAQSDGEELTNPAFSEGVSENPDYNNYFDMMNASAAFSVRWNDNWSWYVRSGIESRDFSARYFYTRSIYDASTEEINSKWALSALTFEEGRHRSEFNVSYRDVEDIFDFNPAISPANIHQTGQFFVNGSHQYNVNTESLGSLSQLRFMVGAQMLNKSIESTDRGNHDNLSGGLYAINTMKYNFGLSVTTSLRFQFNPVSDLSVLPQISASFDAGQVILRGSAGRAIREGDFTERYISHQLPNLTPGRNIGNPDLVPEKSTTIDFGFDWAASDNLRLSPTVFYRSSENLIDYVPTNSNNIDNADNLQENEEYFYASNISETDVIGVEFASIHRARISSRSSLKTEAGYTYIKTTSDENTVSRYIANHPSHQASLDLSLKAGRVSLQSQSTFNVRSEQAAALINAEVPDQYFLTNLRIGYKPFGSKLQLYFQALNVTDTQYQEILGAPMPGRWMLGGVKYTL